MRPVFISYASADSDFAEILRAAIADAGYPLSGGAGEPLVPPDGEIREALALVLVLSRASISESRVTGEWAFALGSNVPVLPLLLQPVESNLHPRLEAIQHLNFSNHLLRPWHLLVQSLRKLEQTARAAPSPVPRQAPLVVQKAAIALDSTVEGDREAALATLEEIDHPAATELLAWALHHPFDQVRYAAAIQLAERGDIRSIPVLLQGIREGREEIEPWVLARPGASAVPLLIDALGDENAGVQGQSARALGKIGGAQAVAALVECLSRPDATLRRRAGFALEDAADPSATPALLAASRDPDRDVRRAAIGALVKCAAAGGDGDIVPVLIDTLRDPYDQVGINACEGLAGSRDPRAVPALVDAIITNREQQVRYTCRRAVLTRIGEAAPLLRQAAGDCTDTVLDRIVSILAEMRDEQDFPLFIKAARSPNIDTRKGGVVALTDRRAQSAVPVLIERLHDEDEVVRELAARALGEIRHPDSIPALVASLDDDDLAELARDALLNFGTKQARNALRAWKEQNVKRGENHGLEK